MRHEMTRQATTGQVMVLRIRRAGAAGATRVIPGPACAAHAGRSGAAWRVGMPRCAMPHRRAISARRRAAG
ncbi:hypothetical protein, partial [Novacetimonas hansenii]|uniref:hypothetical protein n=1 Tax=Novacetimonas hansenii TaxID=436 RepID=UPI000A91973E